MSIIGIIALAGLSLPAFSLDTLQTWNMKIINNTNNIELSTADIYVMIKGLDHDNDKQDVLVRYATNGTLMGYANVTASTKTEDFCYPLCLFPNNTVPLPLLRSGRIYFSYKGKMKMPIVKDAHGRDTIADTSCFPTVPSDSLYKYFQNIEYTWLNTGNIDSPANGTWINPTAVDFVSLPIHIAYNGNEGGLKNISRKTILDRLKVAFNSVPANDAWNKLIVEDPSVSNQTLRICAPGKSFVPGSNDPRIVLREFPIRYLDNYIDRVWEYYAQAGKCIYVDCKEIKGDPDNTKYRDYTDAELMIKVNVGSDGYMHLTNMPGAHPAINERLDGPYHNSRTKPATFAIFAGDGAVDSDPFKVINHKLSALVIRQLCSAIEVGLLPQETNVTLGLPFYKSDAILGGGIGTPTCKMYTTNPLTKPGNTAPWYDLYAGTVHKSAPSLYAWAFDDVLGMDGTCHGSRTPSTPVTVTLGDVSDIHFSERPPADESVYKALVATPPDITIEILSNCTPSIDHPSTTVVPEDNSGWMTKVNSPLILKMTHSESASPKTVEVYLKENTGGGHTVIPPHDLVINWIGDPGGWSISPSNAKW